MSNIDNYKTKLDRCVFGIIKCLYEKLGVFLSIIISLIIFIIIITSIIYVLSEYSCGFNLIDKGPIGDSIGGMSAPIIGIISAFLTFIAFYIQKIANDNTFKQFKSQEESEHQIFLLNSFKNKLELISNDINNFNISFHEQKLIGTVRDIPNFTGKKYNFIGVQGIALFLVEYFENLKEDQNIELNNNKFIEKTYNLTFLQVTNYVIFFNDIIIELERSEISDNYKKEIESIINYTYYTKVSSIVEYLYFNNLSEELSNHVEAIYNKFNPQ